MAELQNVEIQIEGVQNDDNQTAESRFKSGEETEESQAKKEGRTSEEDKSGDGNEIEEGKGNEEQQKGARSDKVKGYLSGIKAYVWTATFGLLFFFFVFLIAFGLIMRAVEGPNETEKNMRIAERRENRSSNNYTELLEEALDMLTDSSANALSMTDAMELLENLVAAANDTETETNKWSYVGSIFFMLTVLTTIGYGETAPDTSAGQVLVVIFAIIGIPVSFALFYKMGDILLQMIDNASRKYLQKHEDNKDNKLVALHANWVAYAEEKLKLRGETIDKITRLACFVVFTFVILIFIPALVICALEDWSYAQGVYYCIITLTTIGFGDLTPGLDNVSSAVNDLYLVMVGFWIIFGLACMFVIIEELQKNVQKVAEAGGKSDKQKEEEAEKEENEMQEYAKELADKKLKEGMGKIADMGKKIKDSKMAGDVGTKLKKEMGNKFKQLTE